MPSKRVSNARMDAIEARINARMDAFEAHMDARFEKFRLEMLLRMFAFWSATVIPIIGVSRNREARPD